MGPFFPRKLIEARGNDYVRQNNDTLKTGGYHGDAADHEDSTLDTDGSLLVQ